VSLEAMSELVDRWTEQPAFREQMRKDPEAAVRTSGLQLDSEEWAIIRSTDWSLSDEELRERVSKQAC